MGVVPALDVAEDGHPGLGVALEGLAVEQLALEAGEEALAEGVVVGIADGAHRGDYAGLPAPLSEGYGCELAAVVRVEDDADRLALGHGHVESRGDELGAKV